HTTMYNPRSVLQILRINDLEASVIPLWRAEAEAHAESSNRRSSAAAGGGGGGGGGGAPSRDAISLRSFVSVMERVLQRAILEVATEEQSTGVWLPESQPSSSSSNMMSEGNTSFCLRDALHDLGTVVDVCHCGLVTWSAFTAYLLDTAFTATNAASARWTIDKALCNKYQPPPASSQSSTTGGALLLSPTEPNKKPQFHERKKEAVLLWDEDALDFSPILEALDPAASSDASGRG
ncbi:Hypothetical protein, putative, partial [Bodo saltans]